MQFYDQLEQLFSYGVVAYLAGFTFLLVCWNLGMIVRGVLRLLGIVSGAVD